MDIVGAMELAQALRDLGTDRLIKATLRRALLQAGAPVAAAAAALAPRSRRTTGKPHMADKISVSATLSRRQRTGQEGWATRDTEARVYIGASPRGPAVLAEFGTRARHQKNGKSTGAMPATPFMRPAWEAGKEKVLDDFERLLWIQIQKSAERLARRTAKAAAKR